MDYLLIAFLITGLFPKKRHAKKQDLQNNLLRRQIVAALLSLKQPFYRRNVLVNVQEAAHKHKQCITLLWSCLKFTAHIFPCALIYCYEWFLSDPSCWERVPGYQQGRKRIRPSQSARQHIACRSQPWFLSTYSLVLALVLKTDIGH